MINVSEKFKTTSLNGGYAKAYFTVDGTQVTDIYEMAITNATGMGGAFSVGGFETASFTAKVLASKCPDLSDATIIPYFGYIFEDNTSEYVKRGEYKVLPSSVSIVDGLMTLTAYDRSFWDPKFTETYQPTIEFPTTVGAIVEDIMGDEDFIYYENVLTDPVIYQPPTGVKREVLAYCAGRCGMNCIINNEGVLEFRNVAQTTTSMSLGPSCYAPGGFVINGQNPSTIVALEVINGETSFFSPTTFGDGIVLQMTSVDVLTQAEADEIAEELGITNPSTVSYQGFTLNTTRGFPQIECGDVITGVDVYDSEWSLLVLSQTIVYNGSMNCSFSATVPIDNKIKAGTRVGAVTEFLNSAEQKIDDARRYATDYLVYDPTSGLMVAKLDEEGQKSPSTIETPNVIVNDKGVVIRDGQQVLARYGETTVIGNVGDYGNQATVSPEGFSVQTKFTNDEIIDVAQFGSEDIAMGVGKGEYLYDYAETGTCNYRVSLEPRTGSTVNELLITFFPAAIHVGEATYPLPDVTSQVIFNTANFGSYRVTRYPDGTYEAVSLLPGASPKVIETTARSIRIVTSSAYSRVGSIGIQFNGTDAFARQSGYYISSTMGEYNEPDGYSVEGDTLLNEEVYLFSRTIGSCDKFMVDYEGNVEAKGDLRLGDTERTDATRVGLVNSAADYSLVNNAGGHIGIWDNNNSKWRFYHNGTGFGVDGGVFVRGHNSNIGTVVNGTNMKAAGTSVGAGTVLNVGQISLPAGTWLVIGYIRYPGVSSNGYRCAYLASTTTGNNYAKDIRSYVANTGNPTANVKEVFTVTSNQTVYLNAHSNVATTLNEAAKLYAVRIA